MAITRDHVAATYGNLGPGHRLSPGRVPGVVHALTSLYGDLTYSAAQVLAHHLWRIAQENPHLPAIEAIDSIGEDFGMEPNTDALEHGRGGAFLGGAPLGGGLMDFLKKAGAAAKKAGKAVIATAQKHAPMLKEMAAAAAPIAAQMAMQHLGMLQGDEEPQEGGASMGGLRKLVKHAAPKKMHKKARGGFLMHGIHHMPGEFGRGGALLGGAPLGGRKPQKTEKKAPKTIKPAHPRPRVMSLHEALKA
jgi:hypothetical protein